ncbi:MAG: NTP transferase domain-containing protein [Anaerolineales bacterium]
MKTAILVTARLKSTRLPRKVIKDIQGKPMLVHLLDRLKLANHPDSIIICTSPIPEDDPLIEIAKQENVQFYRGHPDDVLYRLTQAAEQFGVETVINCTADNPLVDPEYIDRLLDFHWQNNHDFSKIEGLPFGTFSYALSYPAMVKACEIKDKVDTEVWGGYFTETGLFSWGIFKVVDPAVRWPELRLTVDTPEDFFLMEKIFGELYTPDEIFTLGEVVNLCKRHPDLAAINADVKQKAAPAISIKNQVEQ